MKEYRLILGAVVAALWCTSFSPSFVKADSPASRIVVITANYLGGTIAAFSVGSSGTITAIPDSVIATKTGPIWLEHSADNRFVFVAQDEGNAVSSFAILPSGKLKWISIADGFGLPTSMRVHPSGALLYSVNTGGGSISKYLIESDGSLKLLLPSVTCGNQPLNIAFSVDGHYCYVANGKDGTVSEYVVNWDGNLVPMAVSAVSVGHVPEFLCAESTGHYLLVVNNGDGTVSSLPIAQDGSLDPKRIQTVKVGTGPSNVVQIAQSEFCVCNLFDRTISLVGLNGSGGLSVDDVVSVGYDAGPEAADVDMVNHRLFIASESNDTLLEYRIGPGGKSVALQASVKTGKQPCDVVVIQVPSTK